MFPILYLDVRDDSFDPQIKETYGDVKLDKWGGKFIWDVPGRRHRKCTAEEHDLIADSLFVGGIIPEYLK